MRLPVLVLLVWATGVAVLVGLTVWRALYRRVTSLSPDERWRRLRTVLFPAFLGPSQLLLFGPWTVHHTNPTEFLVGFWELAPSRVWLIGTRRRRPGHTRPRPAGPMVPALCGSTLRGRRAALGARESAARQLRTTGRRAGSTWHRTRGDRRSKPACGSACSCSPLYSLASSLAQRQLRAESW